MFKSLKLPNGIPLLLEQMSSMRSVAMGIWVLAGSRSEQSKMNGISHFLEHMFFKGTSSRNAQEIAVDIDAIGAELNAFTTKENTAYYIKVTDECVDQGLELLSDIFTGSVFPEEELKREQSVVCEEIRMYLDTPDDYVHDLFAKNVWGNGGIGQPVLGSEDTVKSFTRDSLLDYIESAYGNKSIAISCAGNFDMDQIEGLMKDKFGAIDRLSAKPEPIISDFKGTLNVYEKDLAETHICMGVKGIKQSSHDRYAALLLNTVLGGGLSSRLFQEVREKRGLAYSVYSFLSSYSDTGLWGIYAGTGKENVNKVIETATGEFSSLHETLSDDELERAKRQLKATIMFGLESSSRRMQNLANQQIFYGRHYTPDEILKEINSVTLSDAKDLAARLINSSSLAVTVLGPLKESDIVADVSALYENK